MEQQLLKQILAELQGLNERMISLEERMVALEERMASLEERMVAMEARMSAVEVRLTEMGKDIEQLYFKVNTLSEEVRVNHHFFQSSRKAMHVAGKVFSGV